MSLGVENMSFYVFVGAPTGPDPRRAPPGPRGGPGGGPRAQGPMRAQSARSSLVYIYMVVSILYPSVRFSGKLVPRKLFLSVSHVIDCYINSS